MKRFFIYLMLFSVWLGSVGLSPGAGQIYSKATDFAKSGQTHFAFMHYNWLLRNYPTSKYRKQALFATGEYYFRVLNFRDAAANFQTYLTENPDVEEKIYVLAYLLSIAEREKDEKAVESLGRQIIDLQQVSFVFREKKVITYRSPLYQNYKTVIQIDQIEFYVEGKLFAKVSF